MKRQAITIVAAAIGLVTPAVATNGDNLIGVGPISRALGGTGIAAPQDAISAVFSNPAAMCISPSCASPQVDAALTLFMPEVNASVTQAGNTFTGASRDNYYFIPALGVSFPIGEASSRWRFGFAAYGTTGLGVNYRSTALNQPNYPGYGGLAPLISGEYTDLSILKVAPAIGYAISPNLSIGLSAHVDYATLDIGGGAKNDFGFGGQVGLLWKPVEDISLGFTYINPQSTTFDRILPAFDNVGNPGLYDLTLEAPQQVGLGIAWTGLDDRLLVELNGRWINWSDAEGYSDFDWDDQWVLGIGVQYEVIPQCLWLRAGYNYGSNPVKEHNGWNGTGPPRNVQGGNIPQNYYETFRVIGFPAIVQHHLSFGVGWQIKSNLVLNLAYMHAFEEEINESGTDFTGQPMSLRSSLSEDSVDLALTWRY